MKLSEITNYSEPIADWNALLDAGDTLAKLQATCVEWDCLCADAVWIIRAFSQAEFEDWRKALYLERHGRFMGMERAERGFAVILMPQILFQVGIVASQFHAPWGVAYFRLREFGRIKEVDGVALWQEEK